MRAGKRFPLIVFRLTISLFVFFGFLMIGSAQTKHTPAESFILSKVKAGEYADLEAKFPISSDRIIRGDFLAKLITDSQPRMKVSPNGVFINGAVIDTPLIIPVARIHYEVQLMRCRFEGEADFSKVHFLEALGLSESEFDQFANFRYTEIASNLEADKAIFKGPISLSSAKVGGRAFFRDATFESSAEFTYADIGVLFDVSGGNFQISHEERCFWQRRNSEWRF
jgi:hypothetical protein